MDPGDSAGPLQFRRQWAQILMRRALIFWAVGVNEDSFWGGHICISTTLITKGPHLLFSSEKKKKEKERKQTNKQIQNFLQGQKEEKLLKGQVFGERTQIESCSQCASCEHIKDGQGRCADTRWGDPRTHVFLGTSYKLLKAKWGHCEYSGRRHISALFCFHVARSQHCLTCVTDSLRFFWDTDSSTHSLLRLGGPSGTDSLFFRLRPSTCPATGPSLSIPAPLWGSTAPLGGRVSTQARTPSTAREISMKPLRGCNCKLLRDTQRLIWGFLWISPLAIFLPGLLFPPLPDWLYPRVFDLGECEGKCSHKSPVATEKSWVTWPPNRLTDVGSIDFHLKFLIWDLSIFLDE